MTYFVFKKPTGYGYVTDKKEKTVFMEDYEYLYMTEVLPDIDGKIWDGQEWVAYQSTPQYIYDRIAGYPKLGDQLDAFWHAMNNGVLPKVEPFYSDIKAVKDAFPKE